MRNLLNICAALGLVLIFLACKETGDDGYPVPGIKYLNVDKGGCNNGPDYRSGLESFTNDTAFYFLQGKILKVFVGINYACCAPFATACSVEGGKIVMRINDTCAPPYECYCRCMCYYSFEFNFTDMTKKEYPYEVWLFNPRVGSEKLFRKGVIILD
ncbi:MAG: hypothetical protein ACM3U1_09765 [Chloroflexota bacterium]